MFLNETQAKHMTDFMYLHMAEPGTHHLLLHLHSSFIVHIIKLKC